jgi:putative membrane protein
MRKPACCSRNWITWRRLPKWTTPSAARQGKKMDATVVLLLIALVYLRGWLHLRSMSLHAVGGWRAAGFLLGLLLIWIAVALALASGDTHSLTIHMVQHLVLMSLAPPLIWLGEPVRLLLEGLPRRVGETVALPLFQRRLTRRLGTVLGHPALCWTAATVALAAWHIPAMLTLGMQSDTWHAIEHASFLSAGLLFWWPVVQPWPKSSADRGWSIVLYLFLATLPCDILSGFLVFSERVAYPVYLSTHRHSSLSVLDDQQFAGALMWTAVTIVYLVAGMIVTTQLLSSRAFVKHPRTVEAT